MKSSNVSQSQLKFAINIHDDVVYGTRAWQCKFNSLPSKGFRACLYDSRFARSKNSRKSLGI
jgi:hypothetical protein